MAFRFNTFALLMSLALTSSACTFTWGDGNFDDWDPIEDDGSGAGSTIDTGGAGGAGGGEVGGGGEDPGTGGGAICAIEEPETDGWIACETLAVAPQNLDDYCGPDGDLLPLGWLACHQGYDILNPSDADVLQSCIAAIPAEEACNDDLVIACIDQMYDDACVRDEVGELCAGWGEDCAAFDESFDVEACSTDLNAMNGESIDYVISCINSLPSGTCDERYAQCFESLITMPE